MKFLLVTLMAFSFAPVFAQDMQFKVSAGDESITVSPDLDNEDKILVVAPANKNAVIINILNDEIDKDWKRSFSIYDSADNVIGEFTFMKNGSYCIKYSELKPKLITTQEYYIYTTAIPKDPAKAMLVKIGRILVCKIKIL